MALFGDESDKLDRLRADPQRVGALPELNLLDSTQTENFDRLARMASQVIEAPAAFISVIGADKDLYPGQHGFGEPLASRRTLEGRTFCHYSLLSEQPLVIDDTLASEVFGAVPTVKSMGVRAYMGVPLRTESGQQIGSFCVIDFKPRHWSAQEVKFLSELALTAMREIALRKLLNQQVARYDDTLEMFKSILDALPSLVGYWDAELKNRYANKAYVDYFKWDVSRLKGRHIKELLGERLYEANLPHIQKALAGERVTFERDIPIVGTSGFRHTLATYIPDTRGDKVNGFFVMVNDITSVQRLKQIAEAATQSKSEFLANMSHEIRTPMNAIVGLISLMLSTELTSRQLDYAQKIEGSSQTLLALLNDILDFSKVEAGKMQLESIPFRLDRVMRNLSVLLSSSVANKGIEVLFDIEPGIAPVLLGDALRLQQVLLNLGGNAIKFTSEGKVVISLRQLASSAASVTILFSIEDTGIGVAPEHQAHIFTGFSQAEGSTTRRFGGTGLGLAISKRFVELMGGTLQLRSAEGQGSTFEFTLTFAVAQDVPEELQDRIRMAPLALDVLVVDDNPSAGAIIPKLLQSWGWTSRWAAGGTRALEIIAKQLAQNPAKFPYPLILMDLSMPEMDGWETTKRIRALAQQHQLEQPKIIMLTSHGRKILTHRTEAEQEMLNGVLIKPVTASMLLDAYMEVYSGKATLRRASRRRGKHQLMGLRILLVEDNLVNQQVAKELLSGEGAHVTLAANGRLGVDAVAAATPQFDVVLMDLQMPVMDGYAATHEIRESLGLNALPIVAMTANALLSDRQACLAAGMSEHIGKPFDMGTLVSILIRLTNKDQTNLNSAKP